MSSVTCCDDSAVMQHDPEEIKLNLFSIGNFLSACPYRMPERAKVVRLQNILRIRLKRLTGSTQYTFSERTLEAMRQYFASKDHTGVNALSIDELINLYTSRNGGGQAEMSA